MTEDEAKTKWCPFVRVVHVGELKINSGNRIYNAVSDQTITDGPACCIGSECMAWRIRYFGDDVKEGELELGYCGLAGR